MKEQVDVPIVVEGTPLRCGSRRTLALKMRVDVEIREFESRDVALTFDVRAHRPEENRLIVSVGDRLYRPLGKLYPLKSDDLSVAKELINTHFLTGGFDFETNRHRFGDAFNDRALRPVWPSRAFTSSRVGTLGLFTPGFLDGLPTVAESGATDIEEAVLERWRASARETATNVIAVDGKLHVRCAEPVIVVGFFSDGRIVQHVGSALLHAPHLDSPRFDLMDAERRDISYQAALYRHEHVFGCTAEDEALAFVEEVKRRRIGRLGEMIVARGSVARLDGSWPVFDPVAYDTLRFAKCLALARSVVEADGITPAVRRKLAGDLKDVEWYENALRRAIKEHEDWGAPLSTVAARASDVVSSCGKLVGRVGVFADAKIGHMTVKMQRHSLRNGWRAVSEAA